MRVVGGLLIALFVLGAGFVGTMFAASELGGEVVRLDTVDAGGAHHTTHLWVVDDAGFLWLRAGVPTSGWLVRIDANPDVGVERAGVLTRMRAVPVREPGVRDRVHARMAEKYGWADRLIGVLRDPDGSVPVRLETAQAAVPE